MVPKTTLLLTALAFLVLVAPTAAAQDQSRVAATELQISANPFLSVGNTLARGDNTFGFVNAQFCHEAGGFNPQDAQFEVTLEATGQPSWLDVLVSEELTQTITPPIGPTVNQSPECPTDSLLEWTLVATADDTAPYGETAEITAALTVAETGTSHTYQVPEGGQVILSVTIEDDPGDDVLADLENATTSEPGGASGSSSGSGDSEESPAPPVAIIVMAVVGLAFLARRR